MPTYFKFFGYLFGFYIQYYSLSVVGLTSISPTSILTFTRIGCYFFREKQFLPFNVFPTSRYLLPGEKNASDYKCAAYCRAKGIYMYAGLQMGCEGKCYCMDSLEMFSRSPNESCLNCVIGNVSSTGMPILSKLGCTITSGICPVMYVLTICPQGFFNPPLCLDRAKDTCLSNNNFATTSHDGNCTRCSLSNLATFYNDINGNCDVLMETPVIKDFRYTEDISLTNIKSFVNFLAWQNDFNASSSNRIYGSQNQYAVVGLQSTAVVVFMGLNKLPMDLFANQRLYFQHFWFRATAKGAFFFSLWKINQKFREKYLANNPERIDIRDFSTNLGTKYKEVLLDRKLLLDVKHDGVHLIQNINFPIKAIDLSPVEFAYHTLDTSALYGVKSSTQQNWEHGSLYCSYMYSFGFDKPGQYLGGAPTYKNGYERDSLPGWESGKDVRVSLSNYDWYKAHDKVSLLEMTQFQDESGAFQRFAGLTQTNFHFDECLFKFSMAIACPDMCSRQQCGPNNKCKFGCVSGYYGEKCTIKCPRQKYGPNCALDCPSTCSGGNCDSVNGMCLSVCGAGYTGVQCESTCDSGYYGLDCNAKCSTFCTSPGICKADTGACIGGCTTGYQPPLCELSCPSGKYGDYCKKNCGSCKGGEPCDAVTGRCVAGCDINYAPPTCRCKAGNWGDNCEKACGLCGGELPCDPSTGQCTHSASIATDPKDVCAYKTNPPMCICKFGFWGADCKTACGKCLKNFCMADSGVCSVGCEPGFFGDKCDRTCPSNKWGSSCTQSCGNCQNTCDTVNGNCGSNCEVGYQMPMCTSCMAGFWGDSCTLFCGKCKGKRPCGNDGWCPLVTDGASQQVSKYLTPDMKTIKDLLKAIDNLVDSVDTNAIQTLTQASCEPGYQPPVCNCKLGYYGGKCDQICGHCLVGCFDNGTCIGSCSTGYRGLTCQTACPTGTFGPNCKFQCGHCFKNTGCTATDGICTEGCDPGYVIPKCKCNWGYFGENCEKKCGQCAQGTTCSFYDGTCESGCNPGWREPYCNCSVGTYLLDCSGSCGKCIGTCDLYNGTCYGLCDNGFMPPMCKDKCPRGWYGQGCNRQCGHCKDCGKCDAITGNCSTGCDDGYVDPQCTQSCPLGSYGRKCFQRCGHCFNEEPCAPDDGMCDRGCAMGYLPPLCVQQCGNFTWGYNCQTMCGVCRNGESCSQHDGTCPKGCTTGYKPSLCVQKYDTTNGSSPCPAGFYVPPICNIPCGHCLGGQPCNGVSGYCQAGCEAGFEPLLCRSNCALGKFGPNCLEVCGKCAGGTGCRPSDGLCPAGCQQGWYGDKCTYQSQDAASLHFKESAKCVRLASSTFVIVVTVGVQTLLSL